MNGLTSIAEAARKEIGEPILQEPVRISCNQCGRFLTSVFVIPNLVQCRCDKCRMDVMALVGKDREVMTVAVK